MLERLAKTRLILEIPSNDIHRRGIAHTLESNKGAAETIRYLGLYGGRGFAGRYAGLPKFIVPSISWARPFGSDNPDECWLDIRRFARDVSVAWMGTSSSERAQAKVPEAFIYQNTAESGFFGHTLLENVRRAGALAGIISAKREIIGEDAGDTGQAKHKTCAYSQMDDDGRARLIADLGTDMRLLEQRIREISSVLALGYCPLL